MATMTTNEMTTYLKYAAELESSVFRQEQAIEKANKSLVLQKPSSPNIAKPKNKAESMPVPVKPVIKSKFDDTFPSIFFIVASILVPLFMGIDYIFAGLILGIIFAGVLLFQVMKNNTYNKNVVAEYKTAMRAYEKAVKQAQEVYEDEMYTYQAEAAAAQKAYDSAYAVAQQKYNCAKDAVSQMNLPLAQTKATLEKLYSADIIFPKYRDMVAMCTMYEYFVTGRCTELTGPNGAYNLYESELRQNLIINRLDRIITQLEQIKQNQYTLYQEMRTTNRILTDISSDVKGILDTTKEIRNAANITAHCAQVTAKNLEALKYIALVNR